MVRYFKSVLAISVVLGLFAYSATAICGPFFSISGQTFNDLNGDGSSDGGTDPGLNGVTVQLYFGTSTNLVATTTTSSGGLYSFNGLSPVGYTVKEDLSQAALTGSVGTVPSGGSYFVNVIENVTGKDFGYFQLVSVSGSVYNDLNGNGSQGAGEPGLSGWTVQLLNSSNMVVQTTTTDALGNYSFSGVGPGAFTVQEVLMPGWNTTQPTVPGDYSFTTTSGENTTGFAFGNTVAVSAAPEPATLALLGIGFAGLGFSRRQRKQ